MKRLTVFLVTVLCLTCASAYARSLGDIAREEQKRREAVSDRVAVIEYAQPDRVTLIETDADEEDASAEAENTETAKEDENTASNELTDIFGKPESQWRKTMADARNNLKQLEDEEKVLASRRNALQLQHSRTDGARRAPIRKELDNARQELDLARKNLEQAREELQSLQNEARSSGALPGWIE